MKMRNRAVVVSLFVFALATGYALASETDAVMKPILAFLESFNGGDIAGAKATHAAVATITDEVPPFFWRGPEAVEAWAAALAADSSKNAITDQSVTLGRASRVELDQDRAYVITPAVYTFKQKGVAMREEAQITFTLERGATGWLITGWTWTGPKPSVAKP